MEKTFAQISELFDQFSKDASLQVEKRKQSCRNPCPQSITELEKLPQTFQKRVTEASK